MTLQTRRATHHWSRFGALLKGELRAPGPGERLRLCRRTAWPAPPGGWASATRASCGAWLAKALRGFPAVQIDREQTDPAMAVESGKIEDRRVVATAVGRSSAGTTAWTSGAGGGGRGVRADGSGAGHLRVCFGGSTRCSGDERLRAAGGHLEQPTSGTSRASKTYVTKRRCGRRRGGDGGHRAAPGAGPAGEAGAPAGGHGPTRATGTGVKGLAPGQPRSTRSRSTPRLRGSRAGHSLGEVPGTLLEAVVSLFPFAVAAAHADPNGPYPTTLWRRC